MYKLILACWISVVPAAWADAPPTIDMTVLIVDEQGHTMKYQGEASADDPDCKKCSQLTLGKAISFALNTSFQDERNMPGDQRWARSILADRIRSEKAANLTAKEVSTIETVVEKLYSGQIIKQIVPRIDPNRKVPDLQ